MLRRSFLAATASPVIAALREDRLEKAESILEQAILWGDIHYYSLYVRQGQRRHRSAGGPDINIDTPFLLASITKPMTVAGLMVLVDSGHMRLSDPIQKYIPEFKNGDRGKVTLHHLATHTSGLPDMLPENEALRARHAPLKWFVEGTCEVALQFAPGTQCKYQSMGILLIAEAVERVTGAPFREHLARHVFRPLGMETASLGMGGRKIEDTALCQVTGNDGWNWNSPYWRDLGAPWGGAHASAEDVGKCLEYFLHPDWRMLRPATARKMITDQNAGLNEPWGLGWMVRSARFGKACSEHTFGHWGSTGTVAWADPATDAVCVLLTTRPAAESRSSVLGPVSDAVAEAAS